MENKTKNESLLKFIYLIRKHLPRSVIYYIFYFIFKFQGILTSTTNLKNYESKDNNITSIHSIISILSIYHFSFKIVNKNYQIFSFIIFVYNFLIVIYFFSIYKKLNCIFIKSFIDNQANNMTKLTKKINIFLKIITSIVIFINFFSGIICEYLSFGIMAPLIKNMLINSSKIKFENKKYIDDYFNNSFFPIHLIMIFNIFSFIIFYSIGFIFLKLNNIESLFSKYGISLYLGKKQNIFIFILTLIQPIYGYTYIFEDDTRNKIRLYICILLICFLTIIIISNIHDYTFFIGSIIPSLNLGIIIFCWYNGIVELILFYLLEKKEKMTQAFSLIKLFISIITTILILYIIIFKNIQYFSNLFSKHLFSAEDKITNIGEIYEYIRAFCNFRKSNYKNFEQIFELINIHKQKCTQSNCVCNSLFNTITLIDNNQCQVLKNELNILGEQEINNRIFSLYKTKKFNYTLEYYCVLHVQYLYAISQKNFLSLYFSNRYLQCPIKMGITTRYYLYELKKQILQQIFSKKIQLEDNIIGKTNFDVHKANLPIFTHLLEFYNFSIFIDIIKKLLLENCLYLQVVFSFRKEMNKSSKLNSLNKKTFIKFLDSCEKIKENDEEIQKLLKNYLVNKTLHNYEICYLLTNYFILIHHHIPKDISKLFQEHYHFSLISSLIDNDDMEFNMKYPMIITLSNISDCFLITYINNILCENLGYLKGKIINSDFNVLIPFQIREEHNLVMKQFLFLSNPLFSKKSYILDFEKYLTQCHFECRLLPDLKNSFHIIINFKLLVNEEEETITYSVFLDKDFNFVSLCRDFEQLFFFNMKMFGILNINFCEFFGLNENQLRSKLKRNQTNIQLDSFWKIEDKAYCIFSKIPLEKIFNYRKTKESIIHLQKKIIKHTENIEKKQILEGLTNLVKTIDEIGLDIEWYKRVKCLGERLKVELPEHSLISHSNKKRRKSYNSKTFEANFYGKIIGYIPYCLVDIKERTNLKELAESTFDISKKFLNIEKRMSYFNPQLATSFYDENIFPNKNQFQRDYSIATPIASKSSLKGNKILANLNNIITFSDLNNSNSFQNNSKMGLLNFTNSSKNLNHHFQIKNEVAIINQTPTPTPNPQATYKHEVTILNGFQEFKNKDLIKEQLMKKFNWNKKMLSFTDNKYKFIEKIIILLFFIIIVLAMILLIIKKQKINNFRKLFACNTYIEMLKNDIYLSSLIALRKCLDMSINDFDEDSYKYSLALKILSLREHSTNFNYYINSLGKSTDIKNIFNLIYQNYDFFSLNNDWSISKKYSSFFEEINMYIYLLSQNYFNNEVRCDINNFLNENFLDFNNNENDYINPSLHEKLTFYSIYNIIQKFKFIWENLTHDTVGILLNFSKEICLYIIIFCACICYISLITFILLFKMIFDAKKKIKIILIDLFKPSFNGDLFGNNIKNFINLLQEFNGNNIYNFEENKDKGLEEKNNKLSQEINKKKKNSKKHFSIVNNMLKESSNNKTKNNKEEELYINYENTSKILIPKVFIVSIIISIICFFLMIFILSTNVIYSMNTREKCNYSVIISMNFLERIPKAIELILFSEIGAILNNFTFINNQNNQLIETEEYINYYNLKINEKLNSLITQINNSEYANLYILGKTIELNIKKYIGYPKSVLNKLKILEFSLNEKNKLCKNSAKNSISTSATFLNQELDYNINSTLKESICIFYCSSTNENGLEIEMNYIYQEITNHFIDLIKLPSIEKQYNYLFNKEVIRANNDFFYAFHLIFDSYSNIILEENKISQKKISSHEEVISVVFIFLSVIIIIILIFFIFRKIEKYKDLLIFFYKMY